MRLLLPAALLVAAATARAQSAGPATDAPHAAAPPTLVARALERGRVRVDGHLDDEAWARVEAATGFTQRNPSSGSPATERTEARIAYDDDALYVALRLYDAHPDSIAAQLARRDASGIYSDWAHVMIDSYGDRRTAFRFSVNPAGVQKDVFHFNDTDEDLLWDAVWESATRVDSLGWTAELRIPLSQLRFATPRAGRETRWGVQFAREIARRGEYATWSPTPADEPRLVSRFGTLVGLDVLGRARRLELAPYVSSQLTRAPEADDDPFDDASDLGGRIGADLRYRLPGALTLTATVNPDFGQVEADPAVVNLTAFEVRFEERRPFFLEGADIFRYGGTVTHNDNVETQFFYTRRIGRQPQVRASEGDTVAYADVPLQSRILAAAKLSGKTTGGWSLGALGAATRREEARVEYTDGLRTRVVAEPRAGYGVARVRRDLRGGRTVVGGVLTGVQRDVEDPALLPFFARDAVVGGIDWEHGWSQRTWVVSGYLAGSRVRGAPAFVTALQLAPTRLYQRPDAAHLTLDQTRGALDGYMGALSVAKMGGRHWLGSVTYEHTSPGFETNDIGFQTRADQRSLSTALLYRENRVGPLFRFYQLAVFSTHSRNFAGDLIEERYASYNEATLRNFWEVSAEVAVSPAYWDDRLTRGGPLARGPGDVRVRGDVDTDPRRPLSFGAGLEYSGNQADEWRYQASLRATFRPTSAVTATIEPMLERQYDTDQYVFTQLDETAVATYGSRHVFGDVGQSQLSTDVRVEWTFSPTLSFQLFAQPFIASGRFYRYKEFLRPRGFDFAVYGEDAGTITRSGGGAAVTVDPDGAGAAAPFSFPEQDFTVRSLRGNAVVRWEYRPGSTLFVVWQQQREGDAVAADLGLRRDAGRLFRDPARNVFLVKLTYWLTR